MHKLHAIAGIPRSGSTLLCNLLAQNPEFHVSSTSPIASTIGGVSNYWTTSPEIKSELANDQNSAESRMLEALRGMVDGWYFGVPKDSVIFDKGRGWIALVDRLSALDPSARILCCVRDPRDVMASIQRQHLRFPVLDENAQLTLTDRASDLFSTQGMIGGPLTHIEDQIARKSDSIVPVIYEKLSRDPERELRKIYAEIGLDFWVGHDFDNVIDRSTDLDALYLNKFPHNGSGKVEPSSSRWQDVIPGELAKQIIDRYPVFSNLFGYA